MLMLEAKNQEGSPSRKAWKHRLAIAIDSIYFDIAMDCWLFFLAIFFLARVRSDEFLICYVLFACLEMLLKLSVKGLFRYYRSYRNSVDGVLSVILVIILIVRASRGYNQAFVGDLGVRGIVVVRILLFPRNIIVTPQFMDWRRRHKTAVEYALRGFTHFSFLLLMMFMMLYGFAALGQQIFGGMICKTGAKGEALSNSLYGQNGYWPLNFNDMPSGMVTMFILLHVNNMHITASGFVAVSNQWAEVFFALWYAIGVLFLLNLLTAVLLNEFASYLQQVSSISKADTANPKSKDGDNTTLNNGKVTDSSSSSSAVLNTVKGGLVRLRNFLALPFITLTQFAPVTAVGRAGIASDRSGQDDTKKGAMFGRMFSWASSAEDQVNVGSPHETNSKGQGSNRRNSILPTYNKSIFADTSDRLHLDDWVSTYYLALKKNENRISLSVGNERESNDVLVLPRLTEVSGSVRNPISRPIDRSSGLGAEQGLNSQNFSQILSVRESLTPLETPFIDDTQRERGLSSPAVPMSPTTAKANSIRSHERAISEEISNRNLNLSHKFQRRQSIFWNLMYAENDMKSYEKAAVLIQFARDGEEHSIASNRRALTCFRIRMKLSNLFRIAAAVLCVLRFFERPLWTFETDGWDDQNTYPMSGIPLLSPYVALAIKLPLLLVLLFGLTLEVIFKENSVVEMLAGANLSAMKVVRYILLLYCFCQLIILLSVAACQCNERLVTVTTIGNLAYLLWFNRRSLYKLKLILRITPQFAAVLFLFFFLCLVFAAIGEFN